MTKEDLISKYGIEISIIVVDEIINEYEENICYCGYDNDYEMWEAKKQGWVDIKNDLLKL